MHRSTRWGYVVDAIVPASKIVILKIPDMNRQFKMELRMFQDMVNRLEGDGYRIVVVPKSSMNDAQINAFCDQISAEPPVAAA